ncbi:MAG: TrkA family potassium uptake protein [Clostridia bacterium]|nr:TrkA family potassium uptake protein [Clostridia bacterium]
MKSFVVIGLERFGKNLAKRLASLGNEVLAIDSNMEKVQSVADVVTHSVAADALDESALKSLGITEFDCVIVTISENMEANILITSMLKEMGVKHVVSKAISNLHAKVLKQVGADKVVFPDKDMAEKLAQNLTASTILDYIDLSDNFSIVEVETPKSWCGKSLKQLNVRAVYGINVVALKNRYSDEINVNLNPDYIFEENDILVVIGANNDINKLVK